jgi:hypothetical protein
MSEDELKARAAGSTMAQIVPAEVLNRLAGGKLGGLTGAIENPVQRIGLSALAHVGLGAPVGVAQQVGINVAEGKPITEGLLQAAGAGAVQAAPGAILSGIHGRAPVAEERPPVTEQPPPPINRAVRPADVLGPDVPDISMPWYKPGPIVTRAQERTAFTPAELVEAVRNMPGGTPEEVQRRLEGLQPEPDWTQQGVFMDSSQAQQAELDRARAAQAPQPIPEQQAIVDRVNTVRGATGAGAVGAAEPWVSKIANRFTAERMAAGEIGPVAPGTGVTKEEMLAKGLQMGPEQITQHISNLMQGVGGDPTLQAAAVRAEEARLAQRSRDLSIISEADPKNSHAKIDADNAFKDVSDFHNGPVAKLKNNWHAQGMTLQGEIPVDLSTYNGMREAFLRDVGKPPPDSMEPALRSSAKKVSDAATEEKVAMQKLSNEIERQTAGKQLSSAEAVRNSISERMGIGPCSI